MSVILVFTILVVLLILGIPVAFSMGLATLAAFYLNGAWGFIPVITQRMYSGSTSFILLSIPFYILAGLLMNAGGMTHRIVNFAQNMVGHITGGMGHVNVLASMIFSGMSGSAVADASGLGIIELKAMESAGYDKGFSAAITAASSTIGPIVPPSIPFVVYGAMTGVSVGKLFLGGIIPGITMGVSLMIAVYFVSRKRSYPKKETFPPFKDILRSAVDAVFALGSVFIIVGGIVSGLFTPTEAAVVACLYALIIGFFVFRDLKINDLPAILWEAGKHSVKVLFIIAVASAYSYSLTLMNAPEKIASLFLGISSNRIILVLIINLLLLLLGCFMESLSIMLLLVPILMPVMIKIGMDPIHFGVMMTLNLMIGLITPPMGLSLYSVSSVSQIPVQEIISELWPYLCSLILVLLLISFVPAISLWLPGSLMK